jgi:hypothetical protein
LRGLDDARHVGVERADLGIDLRKREPEMAHTIIALDALRLATIRHKA